jgi:putative endonuclease
MAIQHWHVYVVRCSDGSLFTGVSEDVERALCALNDGEGSAYVRARTPVFLAYSEEYMNRTDAERRAEAVRRMSRQGKESLFAIAAPAVAPEWRFAS